MTGGGPVNSTHMLSTYSYKLSFEMFKYSKGAAVLADATIGIPFSILILKNYFASIPKDLEEAAYIDGCNKFRAFLKVLIPIAKPGVMVCAIFSFLYAWGIWHME